MKSYDEQRLLANLKKKKSEKNLPFRKTHLYNLILESLQDYHREDKVGMQLVSILSNVQITYEKGLYGHTEKWIEKGLEKSRSNFRFTFELMFVQWKRDLINHLQSTKLKKDMSATVATDLVKLLEAEHAKLLGVMEIDHAAAKLYTKSTLIIRFGKFESLDPTIREIELFKKRFSLASLPFSTQMKIRRAEGIILFAKRDLKAQAASLREAIFLWESHPEMIEEFAQEYALNLNNILVAKIEEGEYEGCEHYLEKLRDFMDDENKKRSPVERIRAYAFYQYNVMKLSNSRGEYQLALQAFDEKRFNASGLDLNTYKRSQILLELGISYLFLGEYRQLARLGLEAIANYENYQEEVLSQIRNLFYIAHFIKGNLETLEQRFKSKDHLIRSWFESFPQEKKLLGELIRTLKKPSNKKAMVEFASNYPAKVHPHFCFYLKRWAQEYGKS
jgi:tetratricopeptide (TPR) repeat protein